MKKNTGILLSISLILFSCEKELKLDLPRTPQQMVVEGWIENGKYAEVILSHSSPYFTKVDSTNIMDLSERWAKVSITSIQDSEILTLQHTEKYFPPFVFKSVQFKGEAGKSYSIEVISEKYGTITATTTIPDPVELDSVWFAVDPGETTKGRLWIRLTDDGSVENYYRLLYKRKGKDKTFVGTNISTFSDAMINGKTSQMGFLRGFSDLSVVEDNHYFESDDTISVKFCTIDAEQFKFWNVYQGKMLASANPLATSNNELISNVKGGLGVWTGYGSTYYVINGY